MDTKKKVLLTGAALAALAPVGAKDAGAVTSANVNIQAIVLRAIALTPQTSLNFGAFSQTGGAGTIVLPPGGGALTYGAGLNAAGLPVPTDAIVQIKATKGINIDLKVTAASATIVNATAKTMKVNNFLIDEAAGMSAFVSAAAVTAKLAAGTATFEVGGTLNVGANQAAGTYTGTFTVSAAYQ